MTKQKQTFFSLFVPTRNRPRTLASCLRCLADIDYDNYEIIVMDNHGVDEVKNVVDSIESDKIKYFRSDKLLPMAENFEAALSHCSGDYISGLGDDDGFLPSTLKVMNQVVQDTSAEIIKVRYHQYFWDDSLFESNSNTLYTGTYGTPRWIPSYDTLKNFYNNNDYSYLPMIYKNFISKDVIARVKKDHGRYFLHAIPDVDSGIVNAAYCERFLDTQLPLAINGDSGKSTGCAHYFRSKGKKRIKEWVKEHGKKDYGELIHSSLIPSPSVTIAIGDSMVRAKELLFSNDSNINVSIPGLLNSMMGALTNDPDSYAVNVKDINALADKYKIPRSSFKIPGKQEIVNSQNHKRGRRNKGALVAPDGKVTVMVDGFVAGIEGVDGAARISEACQFDMLEVWNQLKTKAGVC